MNISNISEFSWIFCKSTCCCTNSWCKHAMFDRNTDDSIINIAFIVSIVDIFKLFGFLQCYHHLRYNHSNQCIECKQSNLCRFWNVCWTVMLCWLKRAANLNRASWQIRMNMNQAIPEVVSLRLIIYIFHHIYIFSFQFSRVKWRCNN